MCGNGVRPGKCIPRKAIAVLDRSPGSIMVVVGV